MQKYRLLAPGPVPIPERVLKTLSEPALHHRTPLFTKYLEYSFEMLKTVFETKEPVLIHSSTGSGAMESAVVNTLNPKDKVLVLVGGKFGERWVEICKRYGLSVVELHVEWGKSVSLDLFEKELKSHSDLKAVFVQACETSTATSFPVQKIAQLTRNFTDALVIVDAITAMGCMDLLMDEWGLDVVIAGSQKAFMLPTGLALIGLSKRAQEASKTSLLPKFYFDWQSELKTYPKTTHFSTPNSLVVALAEVLKIFEEVGMDVVKKRCEALSLATRKAGESIGLKTFSSSPSSSVTALRLPGEIGGEKLRNWLEKEKNITIMGGQDQLKNKILRIGHMGAITNEDMKVLFNSLVEGLEHEGFKVGSHGYESIIDECLKDSKEYFL